MRNQTLQLLAAVLALAFVTARAPAAVTYPDRIGQREFVADLAGLITPEDKARIQASAAKALDEQGIPIIVVTIPSMATYGAEGWDIQRFAMNLFDEWGIGHAGRNAGALVLVSKGDRKARIELGSAWSHDRDAVAQDVMKNVLIPRFKQGDFSGGIAKGVDELASGLGPLAGSGGAASTGGKTPLSIPAPARKSSGRAGSILGSGLCIGIGVIAIIALLVLSRAARGRGAGAMGALGGPGAGYGPGYGPYGYGGGGGMFGGGGFLPGFLMGQWLGGRNSGGGNSSSSGGGGFSSGGSFGGFGGGGGGSFGGGFSGGGGATGSW